MTVARVVPAKPISRLYYELCRLMSAKELDENLRREHADYAPLDGDLESRFHRWSYTRIDGGQLVVGLRQVLRPTDIDALAKAAGCHAAIKGLDPERSLACTLPALGVYQPAPPRGLQTGLNELRGCYATANAWLDGGAGLPAMDVCRRAAERMLKVLVFFLWDLKFDDTIRAVTTGNLHGFKASADVPAEGAPSSQWEAWLHRGELGVLSHLLAAISKETAANGRTVPFLPPDKEVWPESCVGCFKGLAGALQLSVHDATGGQRRKTEEDRVRGQVGAMRKTLDIAEELWVPLSVQFFRRLHDGHGTHYQGLAIDGSTVTVHDVTQELDLHKPMCLREARRAGASVSCVAIREDFLSPP